MSSISGTLSQQQRISDANSVLMDDSAVDLTGTTQHENDYPTHRLKTIKAGINGVQFLVSSKEHLYDVEDMEGGDGVWQAVGVWEDATIIASIRTLRQRQQDKQPSKQVDIAAGKGIVLGIGGGRVLGGLPGAAQQDSHIK